MSEKADKNVDALLPGPDLFDSADDESVCFVPSFSQRTREHDWLVGKYNVFKLRHLCWRAFNL